MAINFIKYFFKSKDRSYKMTLDLLLHNALDALWPSSYLQNDIYSLIYRLNTAFNFCY